MAESTEVIQHEIEETRTDLAEKLAELGDKITGTVEAVEQTVSSVSEMAAETVEAVKETVSSVTERASETVEAVKETVEDTVEAVKGTVSGTVEAVRSAFDLGKQVEEHPWLIFGGSVAVGFLGGTLLGNLTGRSHRAYPRESSWEGQYQAPSGYRQEGYRQERETAHTREPEYREAAPAQTSSGPSWISSVAGNVAEKFAPELSKLKGLALGALFGVIRDTVTRNLPGQLKDEVSNIINNVTESVGGQKLEGPIFEQGEQSDSSAEGEHQNQGERRFQTGQGQSWQDRPQGSSQFSNR
jgi:ElaB/YqjD/DUF883 family membrane-anchored ribosome-binding protein